MTESSGRAARIAEAIKASWPDAQVVLTDDSARHAGHAGAAPGGETHYRLRIVSEGFAGLSRVDRSRAVHAALAAEFAAGLHALNLSLLTPAEALRS
jgi:BolA protein